MSPETSADRDQVQRLLNLVISTPTHLAELSDGDMDLALRVARRVRLLGRTGVRLESEGLIDTLLPAAADQLTSAMAMADVRSRLATWELDRISRAMRHDESSPLVVMKGCAYVLLNLPNAGGRVFADVDLMATEKDLESVESSLNTAGWHGMKLTPYDQNYYRKWTHELPPLVHEEREVEIDLHHNILPRTARLKPSSGQLLKRSRQLPGTRFRVLANEDIVLHAMVHLMFDSDLADKLRDLVDINDLLIHFSAKDEQFWPKFIDRATELDLERPAFYSIHYAKLLLKTEVPDCVTDTIAHWAPFRPVAWIMDRLVPRALFPTHPDKRSRLTDVSRLLLYMRSHWIRMPPWLLAYHLGYKFLAPRV